MLKEPAAGHSKGGAFPDWLVALSASSDSGRFTRRPRTGPLRRARSRAKITHAQHTALSSPRCSRVFPGAVFLDVERRRSCLHDSLAVDSRRSAHSHSGALHSSASPPSATDVKRRSRSRREVFDNGGDAVAKAQTGVCEKKEKEEEEELHWERRWTRLLFDVSSPKSHGCCVWVQDVGVVGAHFGSADADVITGLDTAAQDLESRHGWGPQASEAFKGPLARSRASLR